MIYNLLIFQQYIDVSTVENFQVQNTEEWGRREQLETEKFQLEREIKRLKMQLADSEVGSTCIRRPNAIFSAKS